jgi:hypothetical protein
MVEGGPGLSENLEGNAMLQIIGFVYGLVTLIAGKFWLGKGRVATGAPARIAGAVLAEPFVAFGLGMVLAIAGMKLTTMTAMIIELPLLIAAFIVAFKIAGKAANQQAQGQLAQPQFNPAQFNQPQGQFKGEPAQSQAA